jgi:hypothetical protein
MTNHLSKAKQWIQSSVRTAALTVVPLSTVAVSEATITLPHEATFINSGGSASVLEATSLSYSELNDIKGVHVATTAPLTETTAFWGGGPYMEIDCFFANSAPTTSVLVSGATIPISFQFEINAVNGAAPVGDLYYIVEHQSGGAFISYNYHFTTGGTHTVNVDLQTLMEIPSDVVLRGFSHSAQQVRVQKA